MYEKHNQPSMADDVERRIISCPECGNTIPVHPGYVTWCDGCGWNLNAPVMDEPANLFSKLHLKLGRHLGDNLFRSMLAEEHLQPRLTFATLLAYIIAGVVHSVSILLFLLGIVTIILGWPAIPMVFLGALAVCMAVAMRPRISKPPGPALSRDRFPTLYRLVDEVCDALGARKVDHIVADAEFNASFGVWGWRRKHYLIIGIPLFAMSTNAERVALLGHEIGHSVNGDSSRSLYLGSAISMLVVWYELLRPASLLSSESGMPGLVMLPVNMLLYAAAWCVKQVIDLFVHLLYRCSQRAEYLADYLSAVVGGADAAILSTRILYQHPLFEYTVQRVANNPGGRGLFDELKHQMAILPERELERVRRVSMMEGSRIDTTHPPTPYRILFLEARCQGAPTVVLSPEDAELLNKELATLYDEVAQTVIDQYRRTLYV